MYSNIEELLQACVDTPESKSHLSLSFDSLFVIKLNSVKVQTIYLFLSLSIQTYYFSLLDDDF